jgi:hypothetical protein
MKQKVQHIKANEERLRIFILVAYLIAIATEKEPPEGGKNPHERKWMRRAG